MNQNTLTNALLVCKAESEYKNIGDYIQSIAASQYVDTPHDYIQREQLTDYNGKSTKLIMNGWYMHHPQRWPPSENIKPLLISMHISPSTCNHMLTSEGVKYFRKHGPVGCRDKETMRNMQAHGIPAYFSGCLTLTLGKTYHHNPLATEVIFVDPYFKVSKEPTKLILYAWTLICNWKLVRNICKKKYHNTSTFNLIRTSSFYRTYSRIFEKRLLQNASYITHKIRTTDLGAPNNESVKMEYAHRLLEKYSNANLVITSRIHAALPCLGIGTPVIFVMSNHYIKKPTSKGRFDGILNLFPVIHYVDQNLYGDYLPDHKMDETYQPPKVNETECSRLIKLLDDACLKFTQAA